MRLIDAGRIEKRLLEEEPHDGWDEYYEGFNRMKGIALNAIDATPTIDAVPVVRGEWVKSDDYKGWLVCSACHDCYVDNAWVNGKKWRYCPNCGAKMDEEKGESK